MMRLPRLGSLIVSSLLLGACAQLIGLSDYDSVPGDDSDAGEDSGGRGGKGGKAGSAGQASGGDAGLGGKAGSGASGGSAGSQAGAGAAGASSGNGGAAGQAGEPGESGSGGESGGSTTGGSAGDAGAGGAAERCTEIIELTYSLGALDLTDPSFLNAVYRYDSDPAFGKGISHIAFEFYQDDVGDLDGASKGDFTLGTGIDDNYSSCARCVRAYSEDDTREYFATEGSMIIDSASDQLNGYVNLSVQDLLLREVTINRDDQSFESTVVEGGRCLHVEFADIIANQAWTCDQTYYGDGDCDCGCGIVDIDCANNYAASCEFCELEGSCGTAQCENINVADNSNCEATGWNSEVCSTRWYGDTQCDCGCGIVDVDCTDATDASCFACWCVADGQGACGAASGVDPVDNSQCVMAPPP